MKRNKTRGFISLFDDAMVGLQKIRTICMEYKDKLNKILSRLGFQVNQIENKTDETPEMETAPAITNAETEEPEMPNAPETEESEKPEEETSELEEIKEDIKAMKDSINDLVAIIGQLSAETKEKTDAVTETVNKIAAQPAGDAIVVTPTNVITKELTPTEKRIFAFSKNYDKLYSLASQAEDEK